MAGIRIYPVVEAKDFVYGHRYGWLDALLQAAEGFMLRPEPELGKAFAARLSLRQYLLRRYGVRLDGGVIMMDHGIMSQSFSETFSLPKTSRNIVRVYKVLGVDYGIAFDIPARLGAAAIQDPIAKRAKSVRELSRIAAEEGTKRLREMAEEAERVGFSGLVPVVQGLYKDDVELSAEESVRIMAERRSSFLVAIGTSGRTLTRQDVELIRFAVESVERYAIKYGVSVRIHLLGWSSPERLDLNVIKRIYSADSLTPRRRAVEGKVYVMEGGRLRLVKASEAGRYSCSCPACRDPVLRSYVLDPSGARRNDVRMAHNVYVLQQYLASITTKRSYNAKPEHVL